MSDGNLGKVPLMLQKIPFRTTTVWMVKKNNLCTWPSQVAEASLHESLHNLVPEGWWNHGGGGGGGGDMRLTHVFGNIPSMGTNRFPQKWHFESMIFPNFPRWDMLVPWRVFVCFYVFF